MGQRRLSNRCAPLLHEMAALGDFERRRTAADQGLQRAHRCLTEYRILHADRHEAVAAPAGVTNWNGPYWKKSTLPKDPWGNEYKYQAPGSKGPYDIISLGADGKEGGEGPDKDISSAQ